MDLPVRKVDLPPECARFAESLVASGRFASVEAAVARAFELLKDREAALADVRAKIAVGLEDERHGRVRDAEEVFDELEAEIRRWEQAARKSA